MSQISFKARESMNYFKESIKLVSFSPNLHKLTIHFVGLRSKLAQVFDPRPLS